MCEHTLHSCVTPHSEQKLKEIIDTEQQHHFHYITYCGGLAILHAFSNHVGSESRDSLSLASVTLLRHRWYYVILSALLVVITF